MDSLATQVLEDNDFTPTQQISYPVNQDKTSTVQIGVLTVGSTTYPVKKGINKIGRHPECNIILTDETVSKKHAEIEANSPESPAWICDLHSSNKTKLNNSVLRSGRCYELRDGSVLQFGIVRAIFKVCPSMDDSAIPETPLPSRQKNQLVIPGTPDSSTEMSNASTLGENVSMIPGTQANDRKPTFRLPSVPQRNSTSNKKKIFLNDSSVDGSLNSSRSFTTGDKENVGKPKVSIHDVETQKQFESQNETSVDIHDLETQKISLSSIKIPTKTQVVDIHDMDTQHEESEDNTTGINETNVQYDVDIHDMDTQHEESEDNTTGINETNVQYDVDIHDLKTPKKFCTQDASGDTQDENLETTCTIEVSKIPVREDMSCLKIANENETTDDAKDSEKNSEEYLQLSLATNFEEDCSVLDMSHNLLGSQNLLEHIIEDGEVIDQAKSKLTSAKSENVDDEQSTDYENIFDAVTQVKIHDENDDKDGSQRDMIKVSQGADDSDETNQGVFQSYSYVRSKDNEKSSQNQASDDSDTDEEGHFVKIALQEKQNVSSFFEKRRSDVSEKKHSRGSSKDSEDMFDMLTQHVNPVNKNALIKKNDDDEAEVDSDAPTQIVHRTEKSKTDVETKDSDLMPTQILSTVESPAKEVPSVSLTKHQETAVENDITEIEDDVVTQIITPPEDTSDNDRDKSPSPDQNSLKEDSNEDFDYETAPTQLISDVQTKRSTRKSIVSKNVNLNDTLERNLNAMFNGVNEKSLEDQQEISTQILRNVLQSPQCSDESQSENPKSSPNTESPTIDKAQKFNKRRKSKATSSGQKTLISSNPIDENAHSDSQNYFSALTSARKRNVLSDSQDLSDSSEDTSNNKTKKKSADELETVDTTTDNVHESPSRLKSKSPSTPRSTRRSKREESTVVEEIGVPKSIKDSSSDTEQRKSSKPNPKSPSTPVSTRSKGEESKVTEEIANPETVSAAHDLELSTSNDTEEPQQSSEIYDNYEDILDGLPEVRISGTLSNPPSPTLCTPMGRRMNTRSKKDSENAASKKKRVSRKPSRKASVGRKNTENAAPYQYISKSDSSNRRGSLSQELLTNIDADMSTEIDEKVNKNSKRSTRNSIVGSSQINKESDSLRDRKSIPSNNNVKEQTRLTMSPSVQSNGRTRNSSKKDVDRSSIFQVANEAPVENDTEPVKPNKSASRTGKRSFSAVEVTESNVTKKPREDADESTRKSTRGRKNNARNNPVNRRYSANILNFITNKNSPIDVKATDNSKLPLDESNLINKQAVINIVRLSSQSLTGSLSPSSPVESMAKDTVTDVTNQTQLDETSKTKNGKTVSKLRQVRSRRANKKQEVIVEDSSSQGEESQEVEKILSNSIMEQSIKEHADTKKDVETNKKDIKVRNTRKRAHTNALTDKDESSVSSEDAHFEVPTLKSKRAKISKTISNVSTTVKEETVGKTRSSRQSLRSSQIQPQIISESSSEERLENSGNQNNLDSTISKNNNSKKKGRKPKVGKVKGNKKQNKLEESSISSEINSSVDNASIASTPNRTRRSIPSMSPLKTKHKILFTGISANDYSRSLTKLGASQIEDPTKCTVLVTDKVRRTVKFLCALAQAVPIVSVDWLIESNKVGHFVDLENYILKDPAAEAKFGFKLRSSLKKAEQHKLLAGYSIVLTPNVAPPPVPELKSIIVSCGGKALVRPPPSWPQKAVIISREEDLINAKKFAAKAPKTVTIQSTEFILTGILKQELDFIKYKLT